MSNSYLFPRYRGIQPIRAVRGDGSYVIDERGRRYLDACGGAGISCLGHSEQRVADAISRQASRLAFAHPTFYVSEPAERLAEHLVSRAPGRLSYALFGCGGSEQMDGTLKLARQYFVDKGEPQRTRFVSRRHSFHGNTLGSLGVGGHVARREPYLPLLAQGVHVSPCHAYRFQRADESSQDYVDRLVAELERAIDAAGAETIIGFVAEPVVGAALGAVPAVENYFKRVRDVCDRHGMLLILDEVMCGMGRCGTRFACEVDEVEPDMVVIAKGLGSGYQPISATLVSDEIVDTIMSGRGFFQHGHSYMSHPIACAAALQVQQVIEEDGLLENVNRMGARLRHGLASALGHHPNVGNIRGRGLLQGVELVADRDSREPFEPAHAIWLKVLLAGLDHGLMCYPSGGTVDGVSGDHILLAPPFNVTADDIDVAVERLALALDDAIAAKHTPIEQVLATRQGV